MKHTTTITFLQWEIHPYLFEILRENAIGDVWDIDLISCKQEILESIEDAVRKSEHTEAVEQLEEMIKLSLNLDVINIITLGDNFPIEP
jgi:hypothetical protein